uniref:F-box domain-containing protein n=1 Tax=Caenorhabditis tropicalis TaxID=1561998 RepID=A0A1I7TUU4_9PELO
MSFPLLFHLPSVALRMVLRFMDYREAIQFGLCSKKSKNLIKFECRLKKPPHLTYHNRDKKFDACVSYDKTAVFFSFDSHSSQSVSKMGSKSLELHKIGDTSFTLRNDGDYSYPSHTVYSYFTFWEDAEAGILVFMSYLTDLFGIDIHELLISAESKSVVDWTVNHQKSIDELVYKGNVREIEAMWPREFRRRVIYGFDTDDFTYEDINELLRANSSHVFLRIPEQIDLERVTRGLNATEVTRKKSITYVVSYSGQTPPRDPIGFRFDTSWDFRKEDGSMASVFHSLNEYEGRFAFVMVVWPDSEGNTYDS